MVRSTADTTVVYRGFVFSVHVTQNDDGSKSVRTELKYQATNLTEEEVADRVTIHTVGHDGDEMRCLSAQSTMHHGDIRSIEQRVSYRPSEESSRLPSWVPLVDNSTKEPPISTMVRDAVEATQAAIDDYIEAQATVEVPQGEVEHGLEQALATAVEPVEVSTPTTHRDTEYDAVRPNVDEISRELARNTN